MHSLVLDPMLPSDTFARRRSYGLGIDPFANRSYSKETELPHLIALEAEGGFTLSIASTIEAEAGGLDYSAPDHLLSLTVQNLKGLRQDPALTSRDIANIARSHCLSVDRRTFFHHNDALHIM